MRCAQPDGDIVREVVAAQSQYKRVFDVVSGKNRQIGRTAAKIQQRRAQFLFLGGQDSFSGSQ